MSKDNIDSLCLYEMRSKACIGISEIQRIWKMSKVSTVAFGKYIRTMRKKKNMSRVELAERLYLTEDAVAKWEQGIRMPDFSTIGELSDILEVSVQDIYENSKEDNRKNIQSIVIALILFIGISAAFAYNFVHIKGNNEVDDNIADNGVVDNSTLKETFVYGSKVSIEFSSVENRQVMELVIEYSKQNMSKSMMIVKLTELDIEKDIIESVINSVNIDFCDSALKNAEEKYKSGIKSRNQLSSLLEKEGFEMTEIEYAFSHWREEKYPLITLK